MADYKPPTEQLPIFDSSVFLSGDQALTQNQADKRYLRYPNAQGTENLQAINVNGAADFNSTVNIDGLLTTTNAIDMIGGSTALNNIATRQLSLKDATSGTSNGSSILTNGNVLTVDSVPPTATNSSIQFAVRNTANTAIIPLQLSPTVNNMNVALDMTNTGSYTDAIVRSRLFGLRDLTTSVLTSCGMYFSSNILQIDSTSGTPLTATSMLLRTTTAAGALLNALQLTNATVKTDCPNPLTSDNTNTLATTSWVQSLLSSYIPPQSIKRAWAKKDGISSAATQFTILIPDSGSSSTTWSVNEMVSFRLTFNQEWGRNTGIDQFFNSTTCMLNLYPARFTPGWLGPSAQTPASQFTSGIIPSNQIYGPTSSAAYYFVSGSTPYSRQFWAYNIVNNTAGTAATGLLNISGDVSGLLVNQVTIWVINPAGYNIAPALQNFNLSLELLNPSDLTANITTPGGWDIGF